MSDTLVITPGNLKSPDVDADGRVVLITGSELLIRLTGHPCEVKVIGDGHQITAETVDSFIIQGSHNHISIGILASARIRGEGNQLIWSRAPEGSLAPSFSMNGEGNSVSMT